MRLLVIVGHGAVGFLAVAATGGPPWASVATSLILVTFAIWETE